MTKPDTGGSDTQQQPPHPHDEHYHEHECPDHYHRCHIKTYGYMDCPTHHCHPKERKTKLLKVGCGAQDPSPQVTAFLDDPVNVLPLVTAILDLGHDGWLVVFSVEI